MSCKGANSKSKTNKPLKERPFHLPRGSCDGHLHTLLDKSGDVVDHTESNVCVSILAYAYFNTIDRATGGANAVVAVAVPRSETQWALNLMMLLGTASLDMH